MSRKFHRKFLSENSFGDSAKDSILKTTSISIFSLIANPRTLKWGYPTAFWAITLGKELSQVLELEQIIATLF